MFFFYRFTSVCLILLFSISANATVREWIGSIDNLWNEPLNWLPIGVPTATDSVFSGYAENIVIPFGYDALTKNAYLLGDLTIFGSLTINNGKLQMLSNLTNHGNLTVSNSPDYGISFTTPQLSDTAIIANYGNIFVHNTVFEGILGERRMKMYNYETGLVRIEDYTTHGLFLEFLDNSGLILIDSSGINGIYTDIETDTLINSACGKISSLNTWHIMEGKTLNYGFIQQVSDAEHSFNPAMENHGSIEDINFDFDESDIENLGIWIRRYAGEVVEGASVPIFTIANSASYAFSDIYITKTLTTSAGTYNQASNIWIPNGQALGDSIFFIELTHINGCKDTIKFTLEQFPSSANYWIGGTGNWTQASNWSNGNIPTANEKVAIYNIMDEVIIPSGVEISTNDLYAKGSLTIEQNALLRIEENPGKYTMQCDSCAIANHGSIIVESPEYGININNGKLNNYSYIDCQTTNTCLKLDGSEIDTGVYLKNYGTMTNVNGTLIQSFDPPVYNYEIMQIVSSVYDGLAGPSIINYATIKVDGLYRSAYGIDGNLTNHSTGSVSLKNLERGLTYEVENAGYIEIDNCVYGLRTFGASENYSSGKILLTDNDIGLYISASEFINRNGGEIEIVGGETGLYCDYSSLFLDKFINEGSLEIKNTILNGIEAEGVVENIGQGSLSIREIDGDGILVNGRFINESTIPMTIKNCTNNGILIDQGRLTNGIGAHILIDSVNQNAFNVISNEFITNGYVDNYGSLSTGSNIGNLGFYTSPNSYFENYHCNGIVSSNVAIDIQGTFNNFGAFYQLGNATTTVSNNFTNTGLVWDIHKVITEGSFINEGYHIFPKSGIFEVSEMVQDPIKEDFASSTTYQIASNWYLDEDLGLSGGAYNSTSNSFIPSSNAIDSSIFYFEIFDNSCSPPFIDTISVLFENPILAICGNITWSGGTGLWSHTSNWDRNRIPTSCDTTIIANMSDQVSLGSGDMVLLSQLKNAGSLFIPSNANITISGSSGDGLLNAGQIDNQGSMIIENVAGNGFLGLANSTLMNAGMIRIIDAGANGFSLSQSLTRNKNGAQIWLENSNLANILLKQNAIFYQEGVVLSE